MLLPDGMRKHSHPSRINDCQFMPIHANLNAIVEGGACSAGPASRSSRSSRSSLEQQPEEASVLIGK